MQNASSRKTSTDIVIPDCCNSGVFFRVLLLVNGTIFMATVLPAADLEHGVLAFVEACMILELACLWSLFAVCLVRRALERSAMMNLALWQQRAICALLPAAVSAGIAGTFASSALFEAALGPQVVIKVAGVAALFGLILQHYFELRARAFSPALVAARLQALQSRIRPHFLFNSLNAVLSLIRSEPRRAEAALEDLAELFRVLMRDPLHLTTLEEELRLCRQYLAIESIRLGDRLQVEWDLGNLEGEQLQHAQIPVLLLQPLVENAVRYGVEPLTDPDPVRVRLHRVLDRIEISVSNAFREDCQPAAGNHMALDNIRERLMLLYDLEAQLVTGVTNGSHEVRLRFPYKAGTA